jgi:hypothetical protein
VTVAVAVTGMMRLWSNAWRVKLEVLGAPLRPRLTVPRILIAEVGWSMAEAPLLEFWPPTGAGGLVGVAVDPHLGHDAAGLSFSRSRPAS